VKTLSTVEDKVVTPPPVQMIESPPNAHPVVAETAVEPIKTESHTRPALKKLAPPQREVMSVSEDVKPVSEVSMAPVEPVEVSKPPTVAAPKFESPKPAALSPQIIGPGKKAKVIQWP
jgi:hypothetical protein